MFEALSFTEIDGQQVELLPARTVLSLFGMGSKGGAGGGAGGGGNCNITNSGANSASASGGLINVGLNALNNVTALNNINVIPIGILGHAGCSS
jgi:hypothetical protein